MKSIVLLELARRWEEDAVEPQCQDGAEEARIGNAIAKGERQAKRECADALKMLVSLLGEKVAVILLMLFAAPCFAQDRYPLDTRPAPYVRYGERYSSPYATPPRLYSGSRYLGELSSDRYAPDSVSNPYSRYGSRYSPDSINNPYGPFGRYSTQPIYVYPRRW